LKKLLNNPERITYGRLREVCARHGTEVHAKVRLADVLPIEGSGLPQVLYEFALQAHYDFVVAGADQVPLFAVEFDGPQHAETPQAARDAKKNAISNRLGLPLVRIQAEDLCRDEWQLDRLTEQIEQWFADNARSMGGGDGMQSSSTCPLCGATMIEKPSKYGRFLSCARYPICPGARDLPNSERGTNVRSRRSVLIASAIGMVLVGVVLALFAIFSVKPNTPTPKKFQEKWDDLERLDEAAYPNCAECGTRMVVKTNSQTGEPFFGCPDYPTCRGDTQDVVVPGQREAP
jgi:ssDNA-binding Zn-finger/Zn-ribbon topoisomerase 1